MIAWPQDSSSLALAWPWRSGITGLTVIAGSGPSRPSEEDNPNG
jgi:hypothetical protein